MITITHKGGVGVNSWYAIHRDGVGVAVIERHGMTSCCIRSNHYGERLGFYKNVEAARVAAAALHFPDAREMYETICARTEPLRRAWKERELHGEFVRLARAVTEGSNSARDDIAALFASIEAYATDRSDTQQSRVEDGAWVSRSHTEPLYPEPPQEKAA